MVSWEGLCGGGSSGRLAWEGLLVWSPGRVFWEASLRGSPGKVSRVALLGGPPGRVSWEGLCGGGSSGRLAWEGLLSDQKYVKKGLLRTCIFLIISKNGRITEEGRKRNG